MILTNFSMNIRDADISLEALLGYVFCQASGYSADHTCHVEYDRLRSVLKPEFNITVYFLLGLLPWLNLLFAVQVSDIKKVVQKVVSLYSSHDSEDKNTSSTNK